MTPEITQIRIDQPAPYPGVLMPEATFRQYEFSREGYAELNKFLRDGQSPMACQEPEPHWYQSYFLWAFIGFGLGAITFHK